MYLFPRSPRSGRVVWVVSCAFVCEAKQWGLEFSLMTMDVSTGFLEDDSKEF